MRLGTGRANLDGARVASSRDAPGVLDFLSFDDDDAFNYIVEETRIEKTLVVSQERAQVERGLGRRLH